MNKYRGGNYMYPIFMYQFILRPRKINGLFLVQNFSKLDARTRKNYKTDKKYKTVNILYKHCYWQVKHDNQHPEQYISW